MLFQVYCHILSSSLDEFLFCAGACIDSATETVMQLLLDSNLF